MNKINLRQRLLGLLAATVAFCLACGLYACTDPGKNGNALSIVLEGELTDGMSFPYAAEISLPSAHVENQAGETVSYEIEYRVTSAEGETVSSDFPAFELLPGSYSITYFYSEAVQVTYSFHVKDNNPPVITFTNVPNDLFVGESTSGSLPSVAIEDEAEIDLIEKTLTFAAPGEEPEETAFNAMNDSFTIDGAGVFTFTVAATDTSGNRGENSVSWMVKDYGWSDPDLEPGCVSDFGEEGYLNYVRKGDINPYWTPSNYSQEYLEEFNGASGVLKLGLTFTSVNYTSVNLKLAKPVTQADLKGKYLAVRAYVDGDGLQDWFGFGGIQKIDFGSEISAATIRRSPLVTGQWVTYYLSAEDAVSLRLYSDENDKPEAPVSDICNIQLCFERADTNLSKVYLYLDSITIADRLPAPSGLKVEMNKANWTAVEGAEGYLVVVNGEETLVRDTQIELDESKGYVSVVAIGNGLFTLDSEQSMATFGLKPKEGEYASFDDELYAFLISDDVNIGSETDGYRPVKVENTFVDGKITSVVGVGSWGVCTSLAIRFPAKVDVAGVETLVIRMEASIPGIVQTLMVTTLNFKTLGTITVREGMNSYALDISGAKLTELEGIQFLYLNNPNNTNTAIPGDLTFTFEYIAPGSELGSTTVTVDNTSKTISWTAVENASSYAIVKDGEVVATTTELTYDCSELGTFVNLGVYAVGEGRYLDGETAFADVTLDGEDWISVEGTLNILKISWSTDKLIQLEFVTDTVFTDGTVLKAAGLNMELNGNTFAADSIVWTSVASKVNVNGDFQVKTGDLFTIKAGSLFVDEAGQAYKLGADFTAIFGTEWKTLAGELSFRRTDWSDAKTIQLLCESELVFKQGTVQLDQAVILGNGVPLTLALEWYPDAKKLSLSGNLPASAAEGFVVPTVTIKAGSIIWQYDLAYRFAEDHTFVYNEAQTRWCYLATAEIVKVSWPENANSVQMIMTEDVWTSGENVDAAGMTVLSNGVQVTDLTVTADSARHIHIMGTFSTETAEGYEVPTIVIKAGSVAMQKFTAIVFEKDVTLTWNGSAWVAVI